MPPVMHFPAVAVLALLSGGPTGSESFENIPRGQLVEQVPSSVEAQRFTVYLPTGYDPSRPAPVLYLLDPRGRARVAAKLFQPAAERYGWILISSHNSSSDVAPEVNQRAMQAMWEDSHRWFTVDRCRVYVAGFSGTARMASLMAQQLPDVITGVIGSAAAYHPEVRPSRDSPFLFFGSVGDADYNFHEMESLEQTLVSLDLPHRVARFPGAHSWMPADLAAQAVEWLELRAMQAGSRARDPQLVEAWWQRDEAAALAALSAGRYVEASRRLATMRRDFDGLRETADAERHATRIPAATLKDQLKRRQADGRASREWMRHVMGVISESFPEGADAPARSSAELADALDLERLKRTAAGSPGEPALEARRRLNEIEVQLGFYLPTEAATSADPRRAGYYLSVAHRVDDRSPVSWYLLARMSARLGARGDVVSALRRAYDTGFRDAALLEADPAFERYRSDAGFAAVLTEIRQSGDTLDLPTVDRPPALR